MASPRPTKMMPPIWPFVRRLRSRKRVKVAVSTWPTPESTRLDSVAP